MTFKIANWASGEGDHLDGHSFSGENSNSNIESGRGIIRVSGMLYTLIVFS